jgi:hypothetical protein
VRGCTAVLPRRATSRVCLELRGWGYPASSGFKPRVLPQAAAALYSESGEEGDGVHSAVAGAQRGYVLSPACEAGL